MVAERGAPPDSLARLAVARSPVARSGSRPARARRDARDTLGGTAPAQNPSMTNGLWGAAEAVNGAPPAKPDPQAIAAYMAAGGSPYDLVERSDWFSYSAFDTFERCPRLICRPWTSGRRRTARSRRS